MNGKVQVTGNSPAAAKLCEYLASLGYELTESGAKYLVQIDAHHPGIRQLSVEGIRGGLAEEVQHAIVELCGAAVEWRRAEGGKEHHIRVIASPVHEDAVARGVLRAILRLTGHGLTGHGAEARWFDFLFDLWSKLRGRKAK